MIATRFNNSLLMLKAHFRTATRGNRCGLEEVSSDAVVAGPRPDTRAIVQRTVARACWRSSGQAHAIIQRIADYESHRLVASMFALVIVRFIVGLCLARFNVFAAAMASTVCAAVSLLCGLTGDSTVMYSLLVSVGTACTVQLGYLVGQLLRLPRR